MSQRHWNENGVQSITVWVELGNHFAVYQNNPHLQLDEAKNKAN